MSFMKLQGKEKGVVLLSIALGSVVFFGTVADAATMSTSLDIGSRGSDVIILQTYLAQDAELYPQKLVTGYFGTLTQAAVERFQCRENIVCEEATTASTTGTGSGYGRVGPRTRARLNELLAGMTLTSSSGEVLGVSTGNVSGMPDVSAPIMTGEQVTVGSTFATISWKTNEPAWSQVFYSTTYPFLLFNAQNVKDPSFDTGSGVTIGNLEPNTTYYYVRASADVVNNSTLSVVRSFTTSALGSALPGSISTSTTAVATSTATSSIVATTTSTSTASTTGAY